MTRLLYVGNGTPPRSTENAYRYAFEKLGCEVKLVEQTSRPTIEHVLMQARDCHAVLYTRTHNDTALGLKGEDSGEWTYAWRELESQERPTASIHLDVFVGVQRHGMSGCYDDPLFTTRHVFTPDPLLGDFITTEHTTHHWLPPAADVRDGDAEGEPIAGLDGKVVFVGSRYGTPTHHPEYPFRTRLLDWLLATYGNDFYWYGGGTPLGTLRGKPLWDVYASNCVVIGDSCFAGTRPFYWSDRVPETLAHGGCLIHPYVEGIEQSYPMLRTYKPGDLDDLHEKIAEMLEDLSWLPRNHLRQEIRREHTYVHRARTILDTLGLHYDG